ncbi:legumin B-like [Lotus japonicus]|uniref:legumin B-like n=1 Tax=Lotus japonicus TaxID=34305 RepID=UPI00258E06B5|nr:legumin B-like [Lotus japonicus]
MEMDLTPKTAQPFIEADGGSYYTWTSSQVPLLAKTNVGAGRFVLQPRGLALPHYADISKIGYIVEGTDGVVGMILPNTGKEVVLKLKQGDVIPVPLGAISWWFNDGDSDLIITFLGDTSNAHVPGDFSYFFLSGVQGILGAFSTELTSKAYHLNNDDEVSKLTKSQNEVVIIKLDKNQPMPKPQINLTKELVYDIDVATPEVEVKNGGLVKTLTEEEFPFIGDVGLSVIRVKLEPNAVKAPSYLANPAVQLMYIARGSGKIEIVGLNGKLALDSHVEAGHLLLVPKFFVVAQIAGEEGMESYTMVTTKKPLFEEFSGKASVWGSLAPEVQEVSLKVDSEFQKLFISKIKKTSSIIPPSS